jgi:formylmethanofuran dehydrogenase subunit E
MQAYRILGDEELFEFAWVRVHVAPEDLPGYKAPRAVCAQCGEAVSFRREIERDGRVLCRACAGERYYTPL